MQARGYASDQKQISNPSETAPVDEEQLINACQTNNILRIQSLLLTKVDLFFLTSGGNSVLIFVQSVEALQLILNEAKRRGCIEELLSVKNKLGKTIFEWICFYDYSPKKIPLLKALIENENFRKVAKHDDVLNWVRSVYFYYPSEQKEFDELCDLIKNVAWERTSRVANLDMDAPFFSIPDYYNILFGKSEVPEVNSKEAAIERALVEIAALLDNPKKCIKYLSFLSAEFERYFDEKPGQFDQIDPNTYKFYVIDGTYYPIPTEGYKGFKKDSALQEFLTLLFLEYGLAENAFKWNGYIPNKVAGKMLKNGDFITESRVGSGLLHGKLSHMLQQAIIIFAIKHGEVDLTFSINDKAGKITIKDILSAQITKLQHDTSSNLWMSIRDTRNYSKISFSDPHRLTSVIMYDGKRLGMSALSNYLIDTFCKGYLKYLIALRKNGFPHLDVYTLADKLNDMQIALFSTPAYLLNHFLREDLDKERKVVDSKEGNYSVIRKSYKINNKFKIKPFFEILSLEKKCELQVLENKKEGDAIKSYSEAEVLAMWMQVCSDYIKMQLLIPSSTVPYKASLDQIKIDSVYGNPRKYYGYTEILVSPDCTYPSSLRKELDQQLEKVRQALIDDHEKAITRRIERHELDPRSEEARLNFSRSERLANLCGSAIENAIQHEFKSDLFSDLKDILSYGQKDNNGKKITCNAISLFKLTSQSGLVSKVEEIKNVAAKKLKAECSQFPQDILDNYMSPRTSDKIIAFVNFTVNFNLQEECKNEINSVVEATIKSMLATEEVLDLSLIAYFNKFNLLDENKNAMIGLEKVMSIIIDERECLGRDYERNIGNYLLLAKILNVPAEIVKKTFILFMNSGENKYYIGREDAIHGLFLHNLLDDLKIFDFIFSKIELFEDDINMDSLNKFLDKLRQLHPEYNFSQQQCQIISENVGTAMLSEAEINQTSVANKFKFLGEQIIGFYSEIKNFCFPMLGNVVNHLNDLYWKLSVSEKKKDCSDIIENLKNIGIDLTRAINRHTVFATATVTSANGTTASKQKNASECKIM